MLNRTVTTLLLVATLASGCAATSTFNAAQRGTTLSVNSSAATDTPRTERFQTTSFGNYEFKAEHLAFEPFLGILPLKFNGGYLALDIMFFAPAAFFNLREVYPFYEFDLEKRVVKYRLTESEPWLSYAPLEVETVRAKEFFSKK